MKSNMIFRGPALWPPFVASALAAAQVQADTIAYWRFEGDGVTTPTAGVTQVEDSNGRTVTNTGVGIRAIDVSGNGNTLWAWEHAWAGHTYTSNTPFATVPLTGQANGFSVQNAGSFPAMFTWSAQSLPTGVNVDTWTSLTWTIEASINCTDLAGWRTFVGRDGNGVETANASDAPIYFQKMGDGTNRVRIMYIDAAGLAHQAVDPTAISANTWYNFAATCDGATLKLYKKTGLDTAFVEVASTDVSASTAPALVNPGNDAAGVPWCWTIGRGRYGTSDNAADNHTDRFFGYIDEVRISNVALAPAALLASQNTGDADGDELPDTWETAHGLNPASSAGNDGKNGDPDGDGKTNYEEYLAGSDPQVQASVPGDVDGDTLADDWEITFFGSLAASPGEDPDGDLATNLEEEQAFSNPLDASSFPDLDVAPDTLNDAWERTYFGNLNQDETGDPDGDSYTNLEEHAAGTNPNDAAVSPIAAKLQHRWSFNGTLADSVGTSPAEIVDVGANNATLGAQGVTLTGGTKDASDYVRLGSHLLYGAATPRTIELWTTPNAVQNWSRIFSFHASTTQELAMAWTQGTNLATDRVEWMSKVTATANNTVQPYTLGTEYHIVMTLEPRVGTAGATRVSWYVAPANATTLGGARGSFETTNNLVNYDDVIDALGLSPYGDNVASATYNEVRIWEGALCGGARELLHRQGAENATLTDSDGDHLPDAWEQLYFGNLAQNLSGNPDGDATANREEYFLGSNPISSSSNADDVDGDGMPDQWERDYLGGVAALPDGDADNDFATNLAEYQAGTLPNDRTSFPDADGDLMSDGWEAHYFPPPAANPDGTGDADGDGLTDLAEFTAGTDPTSKLSPGVADGDSDDDGLDDRWEIAWFSSITAQNGTGDADGDGASNLAEYLASSNPTLAASTPTDVDGDGIPDGVKVFDFSTAGGGLLDKNGVATGLTTRLANTGTDATYLPNDPNLLLSTAQGTLAITSTTNDVNGQVGMAGAEMIGIPLSSLGFTGAQDLRIRAKYVNLPAGGGFDQIGIFAGSSSTSVIRGGRIAASGGLGVNTNGANDSNAVFPAASATLAEGRSMTVELNRVAGVWSLTINGIDATPSAQPAFLNALTDLTAGVFHLDGGSGGVHKTATLDSLTIVSFDSGGGGSGPDSDNDGLADAWEQTHFQGLAQGATGDPDRDGIDNLTEFAFNGDPNKPGSLGITSALADTNSNGQRELTLTVAVRSGAVFAAGANGSQVATVEGLTYTVRGSLDLTAFTSAVTHVSSVASGTPGWDLHTFRLDASENLAGRGFLQAGVVKAP